MPSGLDASQYKDYILKLLFMKNVLDKCVRSEDVTNITVPPGGSSTDMVALTKTQEIHDGINKIICKLADDNRHLFEGVVDQADLNDEKNLGEWTCSSTSRASSVPSRSRGCCANRTDSGDLLSNAPAIGR